MALKCSSMSQGSLAALLCNDRTCNHPTASSVPSLTATNIPSCYAVSLKLPLSFHSISFLDIHTYLPPLKEQEGRTPPRQRRDDVVFPLHTVLWVVVLSPSLLVGVAAFSSFRVVLRSFLVLFGGAVFFSRSF